MWPPSSTSALIRKLEGKKIGWKDGGRPVPHAEYRFFDR
jgi:hypothetical protein